MNAVRPLQWCLIALMLLASVGAASAGAPAAPAAPGPTKTPEVVVKGGNYTFAAAPSVSPVYTYWVSIAKAVKTVYPQFNITVTETTGALDITNASRPSRRLWATAWPTWTTPATSAKSSSRASPTRRCGFSGTMIFSSPSGAWPNPRGSSPLRG